MADVTDKLEKLMVMLDRGLITREQFDQQRDELLARTPTKGHLTSIGSYRIIEEIGQGGMGVVYRGRHRNPAFAEQQGGDVAIKVLHAQYTSRPEIVERFDREAALGIKLNHPSIVRVHSLTVDSGQVALIMELIEGRALSEVIGTETGPIPWERAASMIEQLLDGVAYAHAHGVVHRDLKPENVMLDSSGRLKILDFGIAKDLSTGTTKTGTGMGTIDYMAPEQYIDAKNVDHRADIYALGMTFYEMLAGRLPWTDETSQFRILQQKEEGALPPPTRFYPDIHPAIVAVLMRMLSPDQADRFENIEAIRTALSRIDSTSPPRGSETPPRSIESEDRVIEDPMAPHTESDTATPSKKPRRIFGGFDPIFGIAGLLLLLLSFVPIDVDFELEYETADLIEVDVDILSYDNLNTTEPTRSNIREDRVDLGEYRYHSYLTLNIVLGFALLACAMLRTRGRGPAVILVTLFSFATWWLFYRNIGDLEFETRTLWRTDEFDEDWRSERVEWLQFQTMYGFRSQGLELLVILLGYRIGRAFQQGPKSSRDSTLLFGILGGLAVILVAGVHPELGTWNYLFESIQSDEDFIHWLSMYPLHHMTIAGCCLLVLFPRKIGALCAVIVLIAIPIYEHLRNMAAWENWLIPNWKDADFGFEFDLAEIYLADISLCVITVVAWSLVGARLAAGYWWTAPDSPTVSQLGSKP